MKTDSMFFQTSCKALDFLSTEYGYKRFHKKRSIVEWLLYYTNKTAIELAQDSRELYVTMEVHKLDGEKLRIKYLFEHLYMYPHVRPNELAKALDLAPEKFMNHYPRTEQELSELLGYYVTILRSEKHHMLDGDFSDPPQVKAMIEESQREWERVEKFAKEFLKGSNTNQERNK